MVSSVNLVKSLEASIIVDGPDRALHHVSRSYQLGRGKLPFETKLLCDILHIGEHLSNLERAE